MQSTKRKHPLEDHKLALMKYKVSGFSYKEICREIKRQLNLTYSESAVSTFMNRHCQNVFLLDTTDLFLQSNDEFEALSKLHEKAKSFIEDFEKFKKAQQ